MPSKAASVFQMRITLQHTDPPIWRVFKVSSDARLSHLHDVIQAVMGWEDCHLHEFVIAKQRFGPAGDADGYIEDTGQADEDECLIRDVIGRSTRFHYVYDFGDNWNHDVKVEKALVPEEGVTYPVCTAGQRACPPEDCGGAWGYQRLLEVLRDPSTEDYDEMVDWIGPEFDPERFDLAEISARLAGLRPRRRRRK